MDHILVVEDEKSVRDVLKMSWSTMGIKLQPHVMGKRGLNISTTGAALNW